MSHRCPAPRTRFALSVPYASPAPADAHPDDLEEAMRAVSAGRLAAFDTVYRLSKPSLGAFLRRLGADPVMAEDLTHETLLRIYRARGRYREGAKVLTWARTIARRLYIDRLRDKALASVAHASFYEDMPSPFANRQPDDLVALRRLTEAMFGTIERLPRIQAETLRMIHDEGLSFAEASARMGTTEVCLRLRSHRACKALRSALDPDALRP